MKIIYFIVFLYLIDRSFQVGGKGSVKKGTTGGVCGCELKTTSEDSFMYHRVSTLGFYYNILQEIVKGLVSGYFTQALEKAKKQINGKPQYEIFKHGSKKDIVYNLLINNFQVEMLYKDLKKEVKGNMVVDPQLSNKVEFPPEIVDGQYQSKQNGGVFGYYPDYKQYESHLPESFFDDVQNIRVPNDTPKELLDMTRIQRNYTIGRPEDFLQKTLEELVNAHPRMFDIVYYLALFLAEKKLNTQYSYLFNVYEYDSLDMYFTGWNNEKANENTGPESSLFVSKILRCYYNNFNKKSNESVQDCLAAYDNGAFKAGIQFEFPEYQNMSSFFKGVLNYGVNFARVLYSQLAGMLNECNALTLDSTIYDPWTGPRKVVKEAYVNPKRAQTQKNTATNKNVQQQVQTAVKKAVTSKTTTTTTTTKTTATTTTTKTTATGNKKPRERKLPGDDIQSLLQLLPQFLEKFYVKQDQMEGLEDFDAEDIADITEDDTKDAYFRLFKHCLISDSKVTDLKNYSIDQGFSKIPVAGGTKPGSNSDFNNSILMKQNQEYKTILGKQDFNASSKGGKSNKESALMSFDNQPIFFKVTIGLQEYDDAEIPEDIKQQLNNVVKAIDKKSFTVGFAFTRSYKSTFMVKINGQGLLYNGEPCLDLTRAQTLNKRVKKLELREICQRVVEVVNGCVNKFMGEMGRHFEHQSVSPPGTNNFCPGKSLIGGSTNYVPFLAPPPQKPPAQFVFDCMTYFYWLGDILQSNDIKETTRNIIAEFQNQYQGKVGLAFDVEDFIEIYQMLEFFCINTDDKYYKIITPYQTLLQKYIYKWSRGYIRYKRRIILVINFYVVYDPSKGGGPGVQHTPDNTELCFEIEKTLTGKTEVYIDCFKYPDLSPPGSAGQDIPHEYYFLLYMKVIRKHYYYIKKMKLIIDNQITIFDIYKGIMNFLKVKLGNDILEITYKKNGLIMNENGFFLQFKVNTLELLDFSINVRREGENQIRVELKQGFHDIYFFFEIIYEFEQVFSDPSTMPSQDQMIEAKAAYLISLFKPFLQFFFREILFFENQVDYNIIYNSDNFDQFQLEFEPIKKYQNVDAMSYELFCLIFIHNLFQFEINILDQQNFSSFEIMKLQESAPQFFYFTSEDQKKEKFITGYEGLSLDALIIDESPEKQYNQLLSEYYEFLTKANANQLNKPIRFVFGIPKIRRKGYIEIYGVSEGFVPGALIRFYGQGFYNEHYVPFASGYYIDFIFKQIIQEFIKDYHDILHSFHFAQKIQMVTYTPSEVLDLLQTINYLKDFQLDLCYVLKGALEIYLKKDLLYQDGFVRGNGAIDKCGIPLDMKAYQKVIDVQQDFMNGQKVLNVMVTEPMLQHKKQKLQLGDGIFLKQTYRANNMTSQYIFSEQNMKYHKILATKKLRSILYRFLNRQFEKLDEDVEKDVHQFYNIEGINRKK